MPKVKGVIVTAMMGFLNQTYSKESVENAMNRLSAEDGALVRKRFLASSEYPYETMTALRHLMQLLTNRPEDAEAVGAHIATSLFTGPYKPLLAKRPEEMVPKILAIRDFFNRDAQSIEGRMSGPSSCVVTYQYEAGVRPRRSGCRSVTGFWRRVLELSNARDVTSTHPVCACEGGDRCEFMFSWTESA